MNESVVYHGEYKTMAVMGSIKAIPDGSVIYRLDVPAGNAGLLHISSDETSGVQKRLEVDSGDNAMPQTNNSQLVYTNFTVPAASGITIEGTHINGETSTTTTLDPDNAAVPFYQSPGSFYTGRSGQTITHNFS